jgi:hypothetical protein
VCVVRGKRMPRSNAHLSLATQAARKSAAYRVLLDARAALARERKELRVPAQHDTQVRLSLDSLGRHMLIIMVVDALPSSHYRPPQALSRTVSMVRYRNLAPVVLASYNQWLAVVAHYPAVLHRLLLTQLGVNRVQSANDTVNHSRKPSHAHRTATTQVLTIHC